jgi:hypothetical protein
MPDTETCFLIKANLQNILIIYFFFDGTKSA